MTQLNSLTAEEQIFINLLRRVKKTEMTQPTYVPSNFLEQIYLYDEGGTIKLCIYNTSDQAWYFVDLAIL